MSPGTMSPRGMSRNIMSPRGMSRNGTLNRSHSISFLAEHNPDIRVLYEEFKDAMKEAKDKYTGDSMLLDILLNLHVFPSTWDQNNQAIQYLSQSKYNIPIDNPKKEFL